MRAPASLALLVLLAAAPSAAQGVAVPVRCQDQCPPPNRLPRTLTLDSVQVSAILRNGGATTYVRHAFHHGAGGGIDAAFFFPLPDDATVTMVSLRQDSATGTYNRWSDPAESRRILNGILRERPNAELRKYAGRRLVHVPLPSLPAGGTQHVLLVYTQLVRAEGTTLGYRYPLSAGTAATPSHSLEMLVQVYTEAGFRDLRSPSHAVDVQWGSELGRCPPRARCGSTNVASRRVKLVRLRGGRELRTRDFELVYTPAEGPIPPGADEDPFRPVPANASP